MKKIIAFILMLLSFSLVACEKEDTPADDNTNETPINNVENVEGTLEEIMERLYADIPEENLPMALENIVVESENVESFLGTADINYKEILANESMVGSIAHSVVLIRLQDGNDAQNVVEKIETSVNPRKWICIEASNVIVKSKGDLVVLIMSNEDLAPRLEANFNNL